MRLHKKNTLLKLKSLLTGEKIAHAIALIDHLKLKVLIDISTDVGNKNTLITVRATNGFCHDQLLAAPKWMITDGLYRELLER